MLAFFGYVEHLHWQISLNSTNNMRASSVNISKLQRVNLRAHFEDEEVFRALEQNLQISILYLVFFYHLTPFSFLFR